MQFLTTEVIVGGFLCTLPSILLLVYVLRSLRSKPEHTSSSLNLIKLFSIAMASLYMLFSLITTAKYFITLASKTELTPFNMEGAWYVPVMIVYGTLFAPLIVAGVLTYKSLLKKSKITD